MRYTDPVYGTITIREPVILELIGSAPLQRLKHIDQAGYGQAFYPGQTCNRFEHSVGVYLLLRKYGASLNEQISGLIHDISHSAFSHVADHIFRTGSEKEQTHQDNIFVQFTKKSVIPDILHKHRLDTNHIINKKNFPLLETDLPDLCADRIDYSLRDAVHARHADRQDITNFLAHLAVVNRQWVFKTLPTARRYAELFTLLNTAQWSSLTTAAMFKSVSECLQYAMNKNYLSVTDLYTTDEAVVTKIKTHLPRDSTLKKLLNRMSNKVPYENNPKKTLASTFCKSRVVDPFVRYHGKIRRLSELYPHWKNIVQKELKPKPYHIHFTR